jgi:spermidine synthase
MRDDILFICSLLATLLFLYWDAKHLRSTEVHQGSAPWSLRCLLVVSFVTLFAELAFIRWLAVEVRVFAYVKNLTLLVCFLGFGVGCALAKKRPYWMVSAFSIFSLIFLIRSPVIRNHIPYEMISQWLGAGADVEIWKAGAEWHTGHFAIAAAVCGLLLLLLALVFVPVGQTVSRQLNAAALPLAGYSWNLLGSLIGIATFFLICRGMLHPIVWFSIIFLSLAVLETRWRKALAIVSLAVPAALMLYDNPQHVFWTPYQQILTINRVDEHGNGNWLVTDLYVNHTGYQRIVNLSPEFLARYPKLAQEPPQYNPYNVAYRFTVPSPRVLIVGAGTGNDVAAALRNGSTQVDAVEIDPGIVNLGMQLHPEHPYQSPHVNIHVTDARAFLHRASAKYDLIMFGLLDSHTQFSDYSNMRIDNFVYTEESIREAKDRLSDHGVLFIKFEVNRPWIGERIEKLLWTVFGKAPFVFQATSTYAWGATCFAISPSTNFETVIQANPALKRAAGTFLPHGLDSNPVPITTDDWPYLYQQGRWLPRTYWSIGLLVLVLAVALYLIVPESRRQSPSLFFFSMGAGFLLLETQVISRLALFFGTTWQVNGIVIAALLSTLLIANTVIAKRQRPFRKEHLFIGLLVGLGIAYLVPFARIPGSSTVVGCFAAGVFSVPVFFAGLLFASEFRRVDSPSAALGSNILGAMVGGLLENVSLITGMRALLILAGLMYCAAALALYRGKELSYSRVDVPAAN